MESNRISNRTAQPYGKSSQINTPMQYGPPAAKQGKEQVVDLQAPQTSRRRRSIAYIELSPATPTTPTEKPNLTEPPVNVPNGLYASVPNLYNKNTAMTTQAGSGSNNNLPDVVNNTTWNNNMATQKPKFLKQVGYDNDLQPSPHKLATNAASNNTGWSGGAANTQLPVNNPNSNVPNQQNTRQTISQPYDNRYSYAKGLDYRNQPKPSIYEYTNSAYEGGGSTRGRRRRSGNTGQQQQQQQQQQGDGSGDRRRSGSQGKENNRRRSGSQGKDRRRSGSQGKDRRRSGSQGKDQYYRRSSGHGGDSSSVPTTASNQNRSQSQEYHNRRRSGSQGKDVYGQTIRRRSGSQGKEFVNSNRGGTVSVNKDVGNTRSRGNMGGTAYNKFEDTDTTGDEQTYSGKSQYFYNKQFCSDGAPVASEPYRPSGQRSGRSTPVSSLDKESDQFPRTRRQRPQHSRERPTSNPDVDSFPGKPDYVRQNVQQRPDNLNVGLPQIQVQQDQFKQGFDVLKPPLSPTQPTMHASNFASGRDFKSTSHIAAPQAPLQLDIAKYNPNSGVIVHGSSNQENAAPGRRRSYSVCAMLTPESARTPISPSSVKSTVKIPMLRSNNNSRATSPALFSPTSSYQYGPLSPSLDGASGYRSDSAMSAYQQQLSSSPSHESYHGFSSDGGLLSPPQARQRSSTPVKVVTCQRLPQDKIQSPNHDESIVMRGPPLQSVQQPSPITTSQPAFMKQTRQAPQETMFVNAPSRVVPSQYYTHVQPPGAIYSAPSKPPPQIQQQLQQHQHHHPPQPPPRIPPIPPMSQQHPTPPVYQQPPPHAGVSTRQNQQVPHVGTTVRQNHQVPHVGTTLVQNQQIPRAGNTSAQNQQVPASHAKTTQADASVDHKPRRYSEPVHASAVSAAATTSQPSSTFEPRLLMSRRQRRRRSRPLSTCSDEAGSTENLAASSGQLSVHQQRVQAYNQQQGSLAQAPTSQVEPPPIVVTSGMSTNPVNPAPCPPKVIKPVTDNMSPTDWATMTEMEFGKQDPVISPDSTYSKPSTHNEDHRRTRSLSHNAINVSSVNTNDPYSMQHFAGQPPPSVQLSQEPEKSPEEQELARKAALEAARTRRRRSRELNTMNPEMRQILQQQPLGGPPPSISSGSSVSQQKIGSTRQPSSRPSGQRPRRRARSFNAYSNVEGSVAPPPEMAARIRPRPGSAEPQPERHRRGSAEHRRKDQNASTQQHPSVIQQQQKIIQKAPQKPSLSVLQPIPPDNPPEIPPPPDYATACGLVSPPKHLRPMSLPVAGAMSSSSDEMPSPEVRPRSSSKKSQRRRSRDRECEDNIDNMLDMALDNLRDAKVSDKQKQAYGNDAAEKARSRRRLRRRDWIPDHHAIYQSETSEAEIEEEYEKVRRRSCASGLQSPASSSGRNTPFHDEQQLNEEYEKIKKLLGYDKGPDSPKVTKGRPIGSAQSCFDVSQVGVESNGSLQRSESSGNLRNEITDIALERSKSHGNGLSGDGTRLPPVQQKADNSLKAASNGQPQNKMCVANGDSKLPPLVEEVDGHGRKRKGKHKSPRDNVEGSDMDAFTDQQKSATPPPPPPPAAAADQAPPPATAAAATTSSAATNVTTENDVAATAPASTPSPVPSKEPSPQPAQPKEPPVEAPAAAVAPPPQNNNKTAAAVQDKKEASPPPPAAVAAVTTPAPTLAPAPTPAPAPVEEEKPAVVPTPPAAIVKQDIVVKSDVTTNNERNSTPEDKTDSVPPVDTSSSSRNNVVSSTNKEITKKDQTPPPPPAQISAPPQIPVELLNNKESKEQSNREEKEHQQQQQQQNSDGDSDSVIDKKGEMLYKYKEDQWSPVNKEGKKAYDRAFLLQFSETKNKPEGLTHLPDIILDSPLRREEVQSNREMGGVRRDFTPGYIKSMPGKPPASGGPGKRGSQTKHRGGPPGSMEGGRKIISIPLQMDVKLHQTENAWKPNKEKKGDKDMDAEEAKSELLYKTVIGILNKLTPQKFQTLVQQILDLQIDTEERLKGSIDRIFEKAIDEPNFSVAYANMCKCMTVLKVPSDKDPNEPVLFRNLLLNRCQKEFEKDRANQKDIERREQEIEAATSEEEKKKLKEEMQLQQAKDKRRTLGNIRFIGELFKLKMLTEKIMHDCLVRLLKSNDEENLECLCRLMTTIGKDIDHPKNKQRVEMYFQQLDRCVKNRATSSRVRFMIQDLIDLRESKWTPRRDDNNPKTIEQIHKEAQHEHEQKAILVNRLQQESKHLPQGGRGGGGGRRQQQQHQQQQQTAPVGEDGWHSVGGGKSNRIDPDKMKLTRHTMDDNIQLGPGGRPGAFGAWGRGSSGGGRGGAGGGGGGKASSQEQERPQSSNSPANRFSALSASSDNYDARSRGMGRGLPPSRADSRDGKSRGGGGMSRGRGASARSSMEQEREAALAAARNISGGGPRQGGSRNQSRENSRGRDDSRDAMRKQATSSRGPAPAAAAAAPSMSPEELERKTKSTMDEYLHIHDLKEAIACVKELDPTSLHMFVYHALNHVLEKTKQGRQMTGTLLHDLVKNSVITVEQYLQGLHEILEFAEDMEIDIPKVWTYLGEMISPMVQDGSVPLNFLRGACKPVNPQKAGKLLAEVLHDAAQRLGHLVVGEQWRQSGLSWEEFLDPSKNLDEFIRQNKLEFTVGTEEPISPVGKGLSPDQIQQELNQRVVKKKVENSDIIDWIMANVGEANTKDPAFIRALTTAVCSSAIGQSNPQVDLEFLKGRLDLLRRYLDHNEQLELQALYALQALVHKLEHPPGVLRAFFDTLYDEEVIAEDAFKSWDSSTVEMAGKGVARSSVEQFFIWLENAEEDTADN